MSEWISIKKEKPIPFRTVILLENGSNPIIGFMTPNESFYEPVLIDFETERLELNPIGPGRIQLWKPLPEPPKT